jgi:photosystem II stability/assembly factor-like uncharacterized protein
MGANGVVADSTAGGVWGSTYITTPLSAGYADMEFADCNNGIATGSANITVTNDGGKSWIDRTRADFANLFINITGLSYPATNRAWFTTNVGAVYLSSDQGVTMNPMYQDNLLQFTDIATIGNDSIWISAYSAASVAAASKTTSIVRSVNNGTSWQTITGFPMGSTSPNLNRISFSSKNVGYVAGTRNGVLKQLMVVLHGLTSVLSLRLTTHLQVSQVPLSLTRKSRLLMTTM